MTAFSRPNPRRVAAAGLLIAMGVLLPQVFHLAGGRAMGEILLPMHLPVLLAGFCLGPLFGGTVGLLTPAISALATGLQMPPAASLPFMLPELAVYGAAGGIFYRTCRLPSLVSLLFAQLAGRGVKALVLLTVSYGLGQLPPPAAAVGASLVVGLPGLLVQWTAIPLLLLALKKGRVLDNGSGSG